MISLAPDGCLLIVVLSLVCRFCFCVREKEKGIGTMVTLIYISRKKTLVVDIKNMPTIGKETHTPPKHECD